MVVVAKPGGGPLADRARLRSVLTRLRVRRTEIPALRLEDGRRSMRQTNSGLGLGPVGVDPPQTRVDLDPLGSVVPSGPGIERIRGEVAHPLGQPLVPEPQLTAENVVDLVR